MANKESSVKKLEKKLYAKKNTLHTDGRKHFTHTQTSTQTDWVDEEPVEKKPEPKKKKPMTAFTKLLIGAFVFFLLSVVAALLVFNSGQNTTAYDKVGLAVLGPNSIPGGETLSYDVIIQNDNDTEIVLTDIIIAYPDSAFDPTQDGVAMPREIRSIEAIPQGATHTEKFQIVFFGTEGELQDITITYEYRIPGSNAILFKERVYQLQLESSPVSLVVDAPQESLSGENVEIAVEIISNSNQQIENVYLQVDYPFGFSLAESDPAAEEDRDNLFRLGTLDVGESRTIKLFGTISGQDEESRVFRYKVGLFDEEAGEIKNTLQQTETVLAIQKPPASLTLQINGTRESQYIFEAGSSLGMELGYGNNLSSQIQDTEISAKITGNAFSESSIQTDGFYNSGSDTIIWQKTDVPVLAFLTAGAAGSLDARLKLFETSVMAGSVENPFVDIDYELNGRTFDFENNEKPVKAKGNTRVLIPTELSFNSRVVKSLGVFQNTGPLQPTPETVSQYTIVWQVSNATSLVEEAKVQAVLPAYVEYVQGESKDGQSINYDPESRTVTWQVSSLPAGSGFGKPAAETTFQIAVTPSISQSGGLLKLTQDLSVRGFDTYTETARIYSDLEGQDTTSLRTDPTYTPGAELVAE